MKTMSKRNGRVKPPIPTAKSPNNNQNTKRILKLLDHNVTKNTNEESGTFSKSYKRNQARSRSKPCPKENAGNQRNSNTAKSVNNKIKSDKNPKKLVTEQSLKPVKDQQLKMVDKTHQYVMTGQRSKTVELPTANQNFIKNPMFVTSTPKKETIAMPIAPLSNRPNKRPVKPSHQLNETIFETTRSILRSAGPITSLTTFDSSRDVINKIERNHHIFEKSLKIILEDIQAKTPLRRSKSLCADKKSKYTENVNIENHKILKVVLTSSPKKTISSTSNVTPIKPRHLLFNTTQSRSKSAGSVNSLATFDSSRDVINKMERNHYIFEKSLKIILEDIQAKPPLRRSKSLCADIKAKCTENVNTEKHKILTTGLTSSPKKTISSTFNTTQSRSKSAGPINSLTTFDLSRDVINKTERNRNIFERCLKVVLEDIQPKTHLRRSKSLCLDRRAKYTENRSIEKHKIQKVVLMPSPNKNIYSSSNVRPSKRPKKPSHWLNESLFVTTVRKKSISNSASQSSLHQINFSKDVTEIPKNNADAILSKQKLINKRQVTTKKSLENTKSKTEDNGNLRKKHCDTHQPTIKTTSQNFIGEKMLVINLDRLNNQTDFDKLSKIIEENKNHQTQTSNKSKKKLRKNQQPVRKTKTLNLHKLKKKAVTFKPPTALELRNLKPKTYLEESDIETVDQMNKKKYDSIPVYRKPLPESPKRCKTVADLYEFTDISPKKVIKQKTCRRSSMLFDKHIYKVMKSIESKEAKVKKRTKKATKPHLKDYEGIISGIVKNIANKINKKKPIKDEKSAIHKEKAQHDNNANKILVSETELDDEMEIIHSPPGLPSRDNTPEPPRSNVTTEKPLPIPITDINQSTPIPFALPNNVNTKRGINNPQEHVVLHSIHSSDNSLSQQDIDSCFGFEENDPNNINVVRGGAAIDSPANFHVRRPNANSTMCQRVSSPWRPNLNIQKVPHFVSVKNNALPRIDQDMVLDHTFVDQFQKNDSKTVNNNTPAKKSPIQTSILDFVECNVEQKQNMLMQRSLYDVDEFDSPEKISKRKLNGRVKEVRRNLQVVTALGDITNTSPQKRSPLLSLDESQQVIDQPIITTSMVQSVTYFGFEESTGLVEDQENQDENSPGKSSRFNLTTLKQYYKKQKRAERLKEKENAAIPEEINAAQVDESISLMENCSDEVNEDELQLFEEPEEMLDKMAMEVQEKNLKRRRRDSCNSDTSDTGKKKRKHKKTKFELQQEAWINSFNEECHDIEKEQLELE